MKNILEKNYKKDIRKKILRLLLGSITPTVMGIIISSSTIKTWILEVSPSFLENILTTGWIQFSTIIIATIIIPAYIYYLIEKKEYTKKKTGYEILLNLVSNIDNVVEKKRLRFKSIKENNLKSDSAIFRKITQPLQQISYICQALCHMMRFITNDENIKTAIFYCDNNQLEKLFAVCGEDNIKANIDDLNKHSLAKSVLTDGKPLIVNDTEKENKFHKPKGCRAKAISIFPIYEGNNIIFILCFSSHEKDIFNEDYMEQYEKIIDVFTSRIILEWHLFELLNSKRK